MSVNYGLFKSVFKKSIIDSIYNEVISKTARYYHFLGKENPWTDFLSPFIPSQDPLVGDVPGAPSDNFRYELHVRRDILMTKLITPSDVSYVIPRYDWIYGEVYDMYDDALTPDDPAPSGAVRLEDAKFYVLTSEFNVYKCINNNNNSPSLIQPTGTGITVFSTSDGYLWKFMYTIPVSLRNRFLSTQYIPVTTALRNQFYVDGEIIQVTIDNGGSGYINPAVIVSGDGYIKDNPYVVNDVIITNPGDGYSFTPLVTFTYPTVISGSEFIATGEVTMVGGSVDTVTLLQAGYGYQGGSLSPTISVEPPVSGAVAWAINKDLTLGSYVVYNNVYYEVTVAGITGLTAPSHTTGTETNGSASLLYVGTRVQLTPDMKKTEADLSAILGPGGEIVNISVNDGGIGYTWVEIIIKEDATHPVVQNPDETYAVVTANLNVGNVDTLQANVEIMAVPGSIEAMKVVSGGSGYGAANITILGDGVGATATPVVVGGSVVGINITNAGSGYTWTDIVVTGNGNGAVVRAIMSPLKGHGHNAIDEFNANSIMFYSSISRDTNQGLVVTNDYRKAGLLKNITQFNSNNRFNEDVGSGCVLVTGVFDKTKLDYDQSLVQNNATYKKYRIVEFTDTQILVSVFNNFTISPGDVLVNEAGYPIQVNAVSERTIDQFSGDFLFLTVREPFAPSEEQIITVRTVLTL